jgi:cation diffusion facilitator family transporter
VGRPTRHRTGHDDGDAHAPGHDHGDDHGDGVHHDGVQHDGVHHDGVHHDGVTTPADTHTHRRGLAGLVMAVVVPHDHGAHSGERVLESTADGIRAVALSLGILATTAAVELVVAVLSHSVALLADTIHNFADALTAVPLALAFKMGRRPPTRRYTYGFGRAEDLAGVAIVAMIAASTVVAAYEAVSRLMHPRPITGAGWVMAAGGVGFLGNELVAVYRVRVGRRIGSAALVADGMHARSDGFTSLAVVVGAIAVVAGAPRADPIVGVVISAAVIVVLLGATRTIYRRLMDSVDPALVDQVEGVLAGVPGVDRVDGVRIRWVGHELRAEIQISSEPTLSLVDAHAIAEEAHHRLLHDVPRLAEAVIHTSPTGEPGHDAPNYHEAVEHHFAPKPAHVEGRDPHAPPSSSP